MKVELYGLEVFGYHGVLPEEKRDGQAFLYDVELEVVEPAADDIAQAVDYRLVVEAVEQVSASRSFVVAEALAARLPVASARVRVRKPRPGTIPAEWSAATAERSRSG